MSIFNFFPDNFFTQRMLGFWFYKMFCWVSALQGWRNRSLNISFICISVLYLCYLIIDHQYEQENITCLGLEKNLNLTFLYFLSVKGWFHFTKQLNWETMIEVEAVSSTQSVYYSSCCYISVLFYKRIFHSLFYSVAKYRYINAYY